MSTVSRKIRNAPYRTELAQAPGWSYCAKGLDALFFDHPALDDDSLSFYVTFGFMNGEPFSIATYLDPDVEYGRSHVGAPVDIFRIVRDAYPEMTAEGPFHSVSFRYRKSDGWTAAYFHETEAERWDVWRERRRRLEELRLAWFERKARSGGFQRVETHRIEILVDAEYGGYELVPLLLGWTRREMWMMTSGFTNPPSPRDAARPGEDVCDVELLLRCPRPGSSDAGSIAQSSGFQAMTLMAEAFYREYIDSDCPPEIDPTKPVRLETLSAHRGRSRSLAPATPFLVSAVRTPPVDLDEGQRLVPAVVTVESAFGLRFEAMTAEKVYRWTGSLGRTPRRFAEPEEQGLIALLRKELRDGEGIRSQTLSDRMESFACLELYHGRTLPADIAPYLRRVYLLELGPSNWRVHVRRCREWGDHDPERHGETCPSNVVLDTLSAYEGLRRIDLRDSDVRSLGWLSAVPWVDTLLLSGTDIRDFPALNVARDLVHLDLSRTALEDLGQIAGLDKLEKLSLLENPLSDISALAAMTQLKELILWNMPPLDLRPIASLHRLEKLSIAGQPIGDLSFLESCPRLRWLSLAESDVKDLSRLPLLPALEELIVYDAPELRDLSPLRKFSTLATVNASGTAVRDWEPVEHVATVIGRP